MEAQLKIISELGISSDILKARRLQLYKEANSVQLAEIGEDGREHYLIAEATQAWQSMKAGAIKDGVDIFIVSAYRSISRQVEIIRSKIEKGQEIEGIIKVCAPPGYSEHHTGCALDISTSDAEDLSEEFENTNAFKWLTTNAGNYYFYLSYPRNNASGYFYEPWHWKYAAT